MTTNVSIAHPPSPSHRLRDSLFAVGRRPTTVGLMVLSAVLMVGSGAVHFYLWDIAYRHVATLGPLFILQGISAVALAIGLVAWRAAIVVLGSLALMLGTLVGFVLALTTGLFGFDLNIVSGWAITSVIAEGSAVVTLVVSALLLWNEPG
jgi:hypothetical protein